LFLKEVEFEAKFEGKCFHIFEDPEKIFLRTVLEQSISNIKSPPTSFKMPTPLDKALNSKVSLNPILEEIKLMETSEFSPGCVSTYVTKIVKS